MVFFIFFLRKFFKGHASVLGYRRFLRSTLIGGDYELIDRNTLEPNPDYFIAYMWSLYFSPKVLSCSLQGGNHESACYAALARKPAAGDAHTAIIVMNTSVKSTMSFRLKGKFAAFQFRGVGVRGACAVVSRSGKCELLTRASMKATLSRPVMHEDLIVLHPFSYAILLQ